MNAGHLLTIFITELQKLFLRLSSHVGLAVCVILGLLGPIVGFLINYNVTQPMLDAKASGEMQAGLQIDPTLFLADTAVSWSFGIRGFFFVPILIFISNTFLITR